MALEPTLIRPRDLPAAAQSYPNDAMVSDDGSAVQRVTPVQIVNAGAPVPSEAVATAGTDNTARMTPLMVHMVSKQNPTSWADFARFMVIPDGSVVSFNGVQFARDRASNIAGLGPGAGWKPFGGIDVRHFTSSWAVDCGPGLRAARDYCVSIGGGEINIRGRDNVITSTETLYIVSVGSSSYNPVAEAKFGVALPAGVSLRGEGRNLTKLRQGVAAMWTAPIGFIDWKNGKLTGLEIECTGPTLNSNHGVSFAVTNQDHVHSDIELSDLFIHGAGSYGIGYNYGLPVRVLVRDIVVHDTGSDGIDWKVRGSSVAATYAESVVFENIEIRRFGLRITGSSSTGFGLRGPAQIDGLRVYEIADGKVGIQLVPGIANELNQDYRIHANRATVTNWYCEAANRYSTGDIPIGLQVFGTEACDIGPGVSRWCQLSTVPNSATPYAVLGGCRIRGAVIPRGNSTGVYIQAPYTSLDADVQSDYDLYSTKKGNAVAGQTVFYCLAGTGGFAKVVMGGTVLVEGTDYTRSGDTITLTTGLVVDAYLFLIYPPAVAVRVEADYCQTAGRADRWCRRGLAYTSSSNVSTAADIAFAWFGMNSMVRVNSDTVVGLSANGDNMDLRLSGSGTGRAMMRNPGASAIPTSAVGLISGSFWSDGGTLKIV